MVYLLKACKSMIQLYVGKDDLGKILVISNLFSLLLLFIRVCYTGELMFCFMAWNLFLAYLPFAISIAMKRQQAFASVRFFFLITCWILLLPNSFYIITDLFHLEHRNPIPLWFDLVMLFSFAWNGLVLGFLSIYVMEKKFLQSLSDTAMFASITILMFLNSMGLYIGRYLRYNSWDVLTNPFQLLRDIIYLFVHPLRSRFDWSMIICFTCLLMILYTTLKKLGRSLN